jgi:hypothetical protein
VLVLFALGAAAAAAQTTPDPPMHRLARRADTVADQMRDALPRGSGPYELIGATSASYVYLPGLRLRLEDTGLTVRDRRSRIAELSVGRHRLLRHGTAPGLFVFVGLDTDVMPGGRPIARWVREPASARARDLADARRLEREHLHAARPSSVLRRIRHLRAHATIVKVFAPDRSDTNATGDDTRRP